MRNLVSFFAVALTLFLTFSTNSLFAKEWKMNEESSSVRFIYSLEGAAFRGRFRNFSADINFDSSNPEDGSINGVVSIESSRSSSAEHDEYLMEEEWNVMMSSNWFFLLQWNLNLMLQTTKPSSRGIL